MASLSKDVALALFSVPPFSSRVEVTNTADCPKLRACLVNGTSIFLSNVLIHILFGTKLYDLKCYKHFRNCLIKIQFLGKKKICYGIWDSTVYIASSVCNHTHKVDEGNVYEAKFVINKLKGENKMLEMKIKKFKKMKDKVDEGTKRRK